MLFQTFHLLVSLFLFVTVQGLPMFSKETLSLFARLSKDGSEVFTLIAVPEDSSTKLQPDLIIIKYSELYLKQSNTEYPEFSGVILSDGSLKVLSNITTGLPDDKVVDLYLSVDTRTFNFVVQTYKDPSFAIKDGDLTYKFKDGGYAVPYTNFSKGVVYIVRLNSIDKGAVLVKLCAITKKGKPAADFP